MVSATVAQRRFNALLIAAFAVIGLVLASVGIYGVLSISVTQKTREIGIRMALGADRGLVLKMIVGQALALAGTGVALGLLVALVLGQTVTTLLFKVSATDAPTYSLVPAVLLLAALLASLIPARRALAVAPYIALRHE
jgi:putative ABC transport system permease protein